jgi:GT2 family glycosyltransferase
MKTICIGIPVMNCHRETNEFLKLLYKNTTKIDRIIIVDNGSSPEITSSFSNLDSELINKITVIRHEKNIGVRPALNQIWKACNEDICVMTHNDVLFLDNGWDMKVREAFKENPLAGAIGCYGAKKFATDSVYKEEFKMNNLARGYCVSDAVMDKNVHGFRNLVLKQENVVVFDGFFMAIKKEAINKVGGFSDILPQHHGYDNLICLDILTAGYENIVISLKIQHTGGMTDCSQDWAKNFGKDKAQIHFDSHKPIWDKYYGKLPLEIIDIYDESSGNICGYSLMEAGKEIKQRIY